MAKLFRYDDDIFKLRCSTTPLLFDMPRTKQTAKKSTGERAPLLQLSLDPSVVAFPVPTADEQPVKVTKKKLQQMLVIWCRFLPLLCFFSLILVFSGVQVVRMGSIWSTAHSASTDLFVVSVSPSQSPPSSPRRSCSAPCAIWNATATSHIMFVFLLFLFHNLAHHSQAFLNADHQPISSTPTALGALESRGWFCRADSSAFAIVSFRHESVVDVGHPPRVVDAFIKSYFLNGTDSPSRLHYYDLPFSLDTPKLIKNFRSTVELMTEEFKKCVSVTSFLSCDTYCLVD